MIGQPAAAWEAKHRAKEKEETFERTKLKKWEFDYVSIYLHDCPTCKEIPYRATYWSCSTLVHILMFCRLYVYIDWWAFSSALNRVHASASRVVLFLQAGQSVNRYVAPTLARLRRAQTRSLLADTMHTMRVNYEAGVRAAESASVHTTGLLYAHKGDRRQPGSSYWSCKWSLFWQALQTNMRLEKK